jgi:hypothetical protein
VVAASRAMTPSFRIMKNCLKTGSFNKIRPAINWMLMPAATSFIDT